MISFAGEIQPQVRENITDYLSILDIPKKQKKHLGSETLNSLEWEDGYLIYDIAICLVETRPSYRRWCYHKRDL